MAREERQILEDIAADMGRKDAGALTDAELIAALCDGEIKIGGN